MVFSCCTGCISAGKHVCGETDWIVAFGGSMARENIHNISGYSWYDMEIYVRYVRIVGWSLLWHNSRINKNKPRESHKSWRPEFPRSTPRFSRQRPQVLRGRRHEWRFRFWQSSRPHWNQIGNRVLWFRTTFSHHFSIIFPLKRPESRLWPISKKRRCWASCDR